MKRKVKVLPVAIGCAAAWAMAPVAAPAADGLLPGGTSSPQGVTDQIQRQMERDRLLFGQRQLRDAQQRTQIERQLSRTLPYNDPRAETDEWVLGNRQQRLDIEQQRLNDRLWRLDHPPEVRQPAPVLPRNGDPNGANRPVVRPGDGSTALPGSDASSETARRYVEDLLRSYETRQRLR